MHALSKNARLSNKELAARIGLAPSSCLIRVRALIERGVLRGFHADVDPAALGISLEAMIAVKLARHSKHALESLYAHLLRLPEVRSVKNISGPNDLLVHVATRDVHHLRSVIVDSLATRPEVDHCETSVIYDERTNPQLPRPPDFRDSPVPYVQRAARNEPVR